MLPDDLWVIQTGVPDLNKPRECGRSTGRQRQQQEVISILRHFIRARVAFSGSTDLVLLDQISQNEQRIKRN